MKPALDSDTVDTHRDHVLIGTFAKLDKTALGVASGTLFGLIIFSATVFLILKGGATVGTNISLLSQFFKGYSVTLGGSFVGLAYGFLCGFTFGWLVAFLRNLFIAIYLYTAKFKKAMSSLEDYMDGP